MLDLPDLRPTPDRIRETLFNWLRPRLPGTRCLDLYAGTGALGLEAVSQGAASAVLVEKNPRTAARLRETVLALGSNVVDVVEADALDWLGTGAGCFDLVFVDPPYSSKLAGQTLQRLHATGAVGPGSLVYVELGFEGEDTLPPHFLVHRRASSGAVSCALLQVDARN